MNPIAALHAIAQSSDGYNKSVTPEAGWQLLESMGEARWEACDEDGLPLLAAVASWKFMRKDPVHSYGHRPLSELLERMRTTYGARIFDPIAPEAPLPAVLLLDEALERDSQGGIAQSDVAAWVVQHAPREHLATWDQSGETWGTGLMTALIGRSKGLDALKALVARGASWNSRRDDQPVAKGLRIAGEWDAFLAQGGNPDLPVEVPEQPTRPLWQYLVEARGSSFAGHISSWVEERANQEGVSPEAEAVLAKRRYFDNFPTKGFNREKVWLHLTSRADWRELYTPHGAPAWAKAVLLAPALLKLLLKDNPDLLRQKDTSGRSNLWYVWPLFNDHRAQPILEGLDLRASDALDAQGRGLMIHACLEQFPALKRASGLSNMSLVSYPPDVNLQGTSYHALDDNRGQQERSRGLAARSMAYRMGLEAFWGGTPEQQDAAADALIHQMIQSNDSFHRIRVVEGWVRHLAPRHEDDFMPLSPRLKGALTLMHLGGAVITQTHRTFEARQVQEEGPRALLAPYMLQWLDRGELTWPDRASECWNHIQEKRMNNASQDTKVMWAALTPWMERLFLAHSVQAAMDETSPERSSSRRMRM